VLLFLALYFLNTNAIVDLSYKRPPGIPLTWRLIQKDENTTDWMDPIKIIEEECGKATHPGQHSGFMDITDYPLLGKLQIPEPTAIPATCPLNPKAAELIADININNWIDKVQQLSSLPTRYYTNANGEKATVMIYDWLAAMCGSNCKPQYFENNFLQSNVMLILEGDLDERVILGAHLDSTASPSVTNAPGADDDASGVAVLLETVRVLLAAHRTGFRPKRTLEFHFYAAEEVGLRGSQNIAQNYALRRLNIYAMIQFDMVGYKNAEPIFITDYVDSQLTRCLRELTVQLKHSTWGSSTCGYACSDHASFYRNNYRAAFPFETAFSRSNPNIHTVRDLLSILNPEHAKLFLQLAVASSYSLSHY